MQLSGGKPMAIDASGIVGGAVQGYLAGKVTEQIKNVTGENNGPSTTELLKDIHTLLVEAITWLQNQQANSADIFQFVPIYKAGYGAPYVPHYEHRAHIQFMTGPNVTLDVTSPGLGGYTIALTGGTWKTADYPDGTGYLLDASYTQNSIMLWERQTDQAVS